MSTNIVSPAQAQSILLDCISAGLVTMLHGSPGIGKSDIVKQVAETYNLKLIDIRLSQCDPTDISGFPQIQEIKDKDGNTVDKKAAYIPMDVFPLENDSLPLDKDGKEMSGWLLMLDEINQAKQAIQSAAYKLILDRQVGQHNLHKNVAIVCAGNLETDGAITSRVGTALQSRMIHLEIKPDFQGWLSWARDNGIDPRITSFINYMPEKLHFFDPKHKDKTFACP